MSLAVTLKRYRTLSKKSLQELADEVGASKAHIWELETGKSKNPTLELMVKIATALKVKVADLVGENPNSEEAPSQIVGMYRELQKLDPNDLETIQMLMQRMQSSSKDKK